MKKKLIIKESELEEFVKNFLTEEQLEFDFPKDSLTEMMEEKYQEIVDEIKSAIEEADIDSLESIYDEKIFNITKQLHKVPQGMKIVDKFNQLEDILIDYTELYKEHQKIKEELDRTLENLNDLL
jgi:hypothetical protein